MANSPSRDNTPSISKDMLDAGENVLAYLTKIGAPLRTMAREVYTSMASVQRPVGRPGVDPELQNAILSDLRSGISVRQTMFRRKASLYIVNKLKKQI